MASLAAFIAGALVFGAICFSGGWMLRGARDVYRAETGHEEKRDA